ncbi:hypothetical protein [Saccharolobus caldissimus]|uniref:Uncharacterized protein n=1 Tax=Saccharolobus caldissimus TaxID=1702097 RepID=A0AAQ4CTM9_9CREN|nr:hypothetical protein [Saccharolobus caldissimus]BDB99160.1 hypothetical protein SACC_21770 [Saccharolobus caldissimus]
MVYHITLFLLLLFLIAPLSPHESFTYSVEIIHNNVLYLYTYNYTIISLSPLVYNFSILNSNGSILYNKVYTTYNYTLFPPIFVINGSEIHNLTLISTKIQNNINISLYVGYISICGEEMQINLIYHNNILYQANGTSKNVDINVILINNQSSSENVTLFSYLPLIILAIVIVIAIIVLIKIGKI